MVPELIYYQISNTVKILRFSHELKEETLNTQFLFSHSLCNSYLMRWI